AGAKRVRAAASHRLDELARELFHGDVADREPLAVELHVVADRMKEVGLAEPGPAVDEERVVGLAGLLRHGEGGPVSEAVSVADDELPERIAWVEVLAQPTSVRRGGRLGWSPVAGDDLHRGCADRIARGPPECGQVAVLDAGPDVIRSPDEQRPAE